MTEDRNEVARPVNYTDRSPHATAPGPVFAADALGRMSMAAMRELATECARGDDVRRVLRDDPHVRLAFDLEGTAGELYTGDDYDVREVWTASLYWTTPSGRAQVIATEVILDVSATRHWYESVADALIDITKRIRRITSASSLYSR